MRRRAAFTCALGAGALAALGVRAAPPQAQSPQEWLARAQAAAVRLSYEGTVVFSVAGNVTSARVLRLSDRGRQFELVEHLDGQARRVVRLDDVVETLWPDAHLAIVEPRDAVPAFPALDADAARRVAPGYDVVVEGFARVAGRPARELLAKPRDAWRFAQRLWIDSESGLLLRADILGPDGSVLENSMFNALRTPASAPPHRVRQALRRPGGVEVRILHRLPTTLAAQGWDLSAPLAGFDAIACSRRGFVSPGDAADAVVREVVHAVWSDGLTHVSAFIEPYDASRHQPLQGAIGATHTLGRRQAGWWITWMGDVPMATLERFAQALERRP